MTFFLLFLYNFALQTEQALVRPVKELSSYSEDTTNAFDLEEYAGIFLPRFLKNSPLAYFQMQTPPTTREIALVRTYLTAQFPDSTFSTLDIIWLLRDAFENTDLQLLQEVLSRNVTQDAITPLSVVLEEELNILRKLQSIYFKKLCLQSRLNLNELQHLWDIFDAQRSRSSFTEAYNFITKKEKQLLQGKNLQATLLSTKLGWKQQQKLFELASKSSPAKLNLRFNFTEQASLNSVN